MAKEKYICFFFPHEIKHNNFKQYVIYGNWEVPEEIPQFNFGKIGIKQNLHKPDQNLYIQFTKHRTMTKISSIFQVLTTLDIS